MKAVISLLYKYKYIIHTFLSSLESEHIHHTSGFKDNHSSTPSPLPPSLCSVEVVWLYFLFLTIPLFYYIPLTILAIDTLNLKFLTLTILDNCISNHWQYQPLTIVFSVIDISCHLWMPVFQITDKYTSYHWHWQLYLLSLTVVLLTTDISITYDCTSYHWEFYHWWLHFLKLTILNNDNCISYHQQLYFLQPTIVPLTITNCNSIPLTILFLALTILITDNCFVLPVM